MLVPVIDPCSTQTFTNTRRYVQIETRAAELSISAAGPQIHVMAFEIFLLSIVDELYFRRSAHPSTFEEGRRRLQGKLEMLRALEADRIPGRCR